MGNIPIFKNKLEQLNYNYSAEREMIKRVDYTNIKHLFYCMLVNDNNYEMCLIIEKDELNKLSKKDYFCYKNLCFEILCNRIYFKIYTLALNNNDYDRKNESLSIRSEIDDLYKKVEELFNWLNNECHGDLILSGGLIENISVDIDINKTTTEYYYSLYLLLIGEIDLAINHLEYLSSLTIAPAMFQLIQIYTFDDYLNLNRINELYKIVININEDEYNGRLNIPIEECKDFTFEYIADYYLTNGYYDKLFDIVTLYQNVVLKRKNNLLFLSSTSNCSPEEKETINKENEYKINVSKNAEKLYNFYKEKLNLLKQYNISDEKLLSKHFDDEVLNAMSPYEKIFIVTSLKTFEFIKKENQTTYNLDYSAAIISIYKAVEKLLEKVINDYLKYLNNKTKIAISDLNKILLNGNKLKVSLNEELTCGGFLHCIAKKLYNNMNCFNGGNKVLYFADEYFSGFCSKLKINNPNTYIEELAELVDKLNGIRNRTAHKCYITQIDANTTFDILIDAKKLINKLYKDFIINK